MNSADALAAARMERLTPSGPTTLDYADFVASAESYLRRTRAGEVFLIRRNPAISAFVEEFVAPHVADGDFSVFRENSPAVYDTQRLQHALFDPLRDIDGLFVDAFVRLRRTVGRGAFVGPHCDQFEGLPPNCLNFWTTYVPLQAGETLNLLPARWHPATNLAGTAKWGVYRDDEFRLMPRRALLDDVLSFPLEAGDSILFNSGRMPHCSPFFVERHRITSDIRLVLVDRKEELQFKTVSNYYRLADIDAFDGRRAAGEVLAELWRRYDVDIDPFGVHGRDGAQTQAALLDRLAGGVDPTAVIQLWQARRLGGRTELADRVCEAAPMAVAPRLALLDILDDAPGKRNEIAAQLLRLPVENPQRVLAAVSARAAPGRLAALAFRSGAGTRDGIEAAVLAVAMAAISKLPARLRNHRLTNRVAALAARRFFHRNRFWNGKMKLSSRRFKLAMVAARIPTEAGRRLFRRLSGAPRFGHRAQNILFALEFLRQGLVRGRNSLDQIAEFGTASGEGLRQLYILTRHFTDAHGLKMPTIYGFDSFSGLHESTDPSDLGSWSTGDYPGEYETLQNFINHAGWEDNCRLVAGMFGETLPRHPEVVPNLILVDCDYYSSTRDVFEVLKDRIASGTVVYFDDLGTNFYNRNMGEERFIHEVKTGRFGEQYVLNHIHGNCYVWSNSDRPATKKTQDVLRIPLKSETGLGDFY